MISPKTLDETLKLWDAFVPIQLLFSSTTEVNTVITSGSVVADAHTGMFDDWLEYSATKTQAEFDAWLAQSKPWRLRCNRKQTDLTGFKKVYLKSLRIRAYDALQNNALGTAAGQLASMHTALETSLSTNNDAIVQSRFINGEIGNWQPNWASPVIYANGSPVMLGIIETNYSANHKGDKSIGVTLPYELVPETPVLLGKFTGQNGYLEVHCPCVQKIEISGTTYYQLYPVHAEVELIGVR